MIHFCIQSDTPYSLFSDSMADAMGRLGLSSQFCPIGRNWLFKMEKTYVGKLLGHSLLAFINTRIGTKEFISSICPGDIVVSYEMFGLVSNWKDGWFHRAVKDQGAKLVCIIQDAWPALKAPLPRKGCNVRVALSDMVAGVTPNLVNLLKQHYPGKNIVLMEEAIDTDAFLPDFSQNDPVVVWSGPPSKQSEVIKMLPILESAYRQSPFRLRIVSGLKKPTFSTCIPIEWTSFLNSYEEQFLGSTIAFARYPNTVYGHCKGNYKIKTYLAAGCAIVSNPIGYNLELIKPGVNGLLANTPKEWETAFLRLLQNPEERLAMRKESRKAAIQRFSYSAIAKQYAGVLRRLGVESRTVTK